MTFPHPPGTFEADAEIGLPCGSLLVLQGNGADVAQHCVPRVTEDRVSVTLRRMRPVFKVSNTLMHKHARKNATESTQHSTRHPIIRVSVSD